MAESDCSKPHFPGRRVGRDKEMVVAALGQANWERGRCCLEPSDYRSQQGCSPLECDARKAGRTFSSSMPQRWTLLNLLFREEKESKVFEEPLRPRPCCTADRVLREAVLAPGFLEVTHRGKRGSFSQHTRRGCKQHLDDIFFGSFHAFLGFIISSVKIVS